jgi:hypothetical protein
MNAKRERQVKSGTRRFFLSIIGLCWVGQVCATGQVVGNIDGFSADSSGNPVLQGWTCQIGNPNPIQVDIYLNQPYSSQSGSSGQFINRYTANSPSEPGVAAACGTSGKNYRFAIPLPPDQFVAGDPVYAYGVISTGGTQISSTGSFKIPANALATNKPGSVTIGSQFVIYDTGYDTSTGCAPLLDTPLYPITSASADNQGVVVKFVALSDNTGNANYLVSGQINASGSETHSFQVDCTPVLTGPQDSVSTDFRGNQWLYGFTKDANGNVFALVHNEFYGGLYPDANFMIPSSDNCSLGEQPGMLINAAGCTYTALEIAEMPSGSPTFSLMGSPPSGQVAARPPFSYTPNVGQPTGYFTNTNILLNSDGYYYALADDILPDGTNLRCPIRTNNIADPSSWFGWDGSGFAARLSSGSAACANDGLAGIFPFYLGYSSYFKKFIVVGAIPSSSVRGAPTVMAYSVSSDFVNWSQPVSFTVPVFNSPSGAGWASNNYPSLVDVVSIQNSSDPNSSTGAGVGQGPWLVYEQKYVCAPAPDPNCPAAGKPPRTRFAAVSTAFSQ